MKSIIFILSILVLTFFIVSCESSDTPNEEKSITLMDLMPDSNEILGWYENTKMGEPEIEITDELSVATYWVNGAMDSYTKTGGWIALAREFYKKDDTEVSLYIYEMSSKEKASKVFNELLDYTGVEWSDYDFGGGEDNGRFGVIHKYAYSNVTKGKYLIETQTTPETAAEDAKSFCKSILDRIP